jgi:N-methylhydantoinase A
VDIGGTFTDVILLNEDTRRLAMLKVPSTPHKPAAAVREGIRAILATEGVDPRNVIMLIHGTTLALNTLIERSGARIGLLVTDGYRDLLELRRLRLREAQNFYADRPVPLVPRELVYEVEERLLADGSVYLPLNREGVAEAARTFAARGCTAVAICFLHAYRNYVHEQSAREIVEAACPGMYVCTSHEIWPQRREYERCLVTVMNSYMGSRMKAYFNELEATLRRIGMTAPVLSTKSNGGVMTARSAGERPVETLFSGPASGVIAASHLARLIGEERVITLDMGGTSADISVLTGDYKFSVEATAGEFPVILPTIDISSIGAGGGSIAWTDAMGVLKVGPRSAGALPGPACYGQGGEEPTVTDAYVTLGYINPTRFLGGTMPLRGDLAASSLRELGERLGQTAEQSAWSVLEVATANMLAQFAPLMARHGVDPEEYAILAYGGAGPTHAFLLAREIGIRRVIVPALPGGLCALGCLVADLRADFTRTWYRVLDSTTARDLEEAFAGLEAEATRWAVREGLHVAPLRYDRTAEMRYQGQSFEISVPLAPGHLDTILDRFHTLYQTIYGYADRAAPVEVIDIRVQVVGETPKPDFELSVLEPGEARLGDRTVFLDGEPVSVPVYDRWRLEPGGVMCGPLIIEQYDSTTVVPANFRVHLDARGHLIGVAE